MPTFASLQNRRAELIRKGLDASIFVRPAAGAPVVTAITNATGLLALPAGFEDVGMLTADDGATWSRDSDVSDTTSWGYAEPTRRDVISDVSGLSFVAQETNRQTLEMYHGMDLSTTTFDPATGEIVINKASRPALRYLSVLAIAKDGDGLDSIYWARWLPRAAITEVAEQTWQQGEEVRYSVTMTAFVDSVTGTSMREFWGGPAMLGGLATSMGFAAGA